jgi:anti-sigma factor RsiW
MTCKELVELISDYLEGNIDDPTRERLERHLAECDGCTNAMTQFRETIKVTGHITEEQVPEQQRDELLATFRRFKEETAG